MKTRTKDIHTHEKGSHCWHTIITTTIILPENNCGTNTTKSRVTDQRDERAPTQLLLFLRLHFSVPQAATSRIILHAVVLYNTLNDL